MIFAALRIARKGHKHWSNGGVRAARSARSGKQPGDPAKAGLAILKFIEAKNPPTHLLLGNDAIDFVRWDLKKMEAEFAEWEPVTRSTDFD